MPPSTILEFSFQIRQSSEIQEAIVIDDGS